MTKLTIDTRFRKERSITDCIPIDGSQGEGGGQIVRSSLALSLVTGKPVQIENVRAGRDKPGLLRQHLTALRAASEIGDAEVTGDEIGSQCITFRPRTIRSGNYVFSVGTAGSATLVLQTVLPALCFGHSVNSDLGLSEIALEGGTHNPWAPPFDFLKATYFPLLRRMGVTISEGLERHGFYPAGGGRFSVGVEPAESLQGLDLLDRGPIQSRKVVALIANLPGSIAAREMKTIAKKLGWPPSSYEIEPVRDSAGPGNVVMIELQTEKVGALFTAFGRHGVRAENVANEAVKQYRAYIATDAPVGPYLADQLMLPMSIAAWRDGVVSRFRTLPLTQHSLTHIEILRQLLGVSISVEKTAAPDVVEVRIAAR